MRQLIIVLMVLLLLPGVLLGQAKVGTAGAQFLKLGVGARANGMGDAFVAVSNDATAMYYNPAGLTQLYDREVIFTHVDYPAEISYEFVGLAYPLYRVGGVLGFGFYMLNGGSFDETTHEYPLGTGRTFGAREYAATMSYGRNLTDRFSVGLTLKFIDELYEEERSSGWAADVGTNYDTGFRNFKISMVITNFGPDMTFVREGYPLPINFKFGGAINVLDGAKHKGVFALEAMHPSDNLEKYNAGFEYGYDGKYF
ncbi:MAG: PorV/PorQ family protein, partial [candidate division Zixibacteria bacterium]|nr:PorV/PorQ family protein [candidate division Zixibacteria bacterium]